MKCIFLADTTGGMLKADPIMRILESGENVECIRLLSGNGPVWERFHKIRDLVAVVVVLERSGFQNGHYLQLVRACINRTLSKDDFRIYFIPCDMQPEDLKVYAAGHVKKAGVDSMGYDAYSVADSIIDSIHIPEFFMESRAAGEETMQILQADISNYLGRVREIRLKSLYRNIKRKMVSLLGMLSILTQMVSLVILALLFLGKTMGLPLPDAFVGNGALDEVLVSLAAGVFTVPMIMIPLLFVLKPSQWSRYRRKWTILLFAVLVPSMLFSLQLKPYLHGNTYLIGIFGGWVLDFMRRQRTMANGDTFAFDNFDRIYENEIPSQDYAGKSNQLLLPWFCSMINPDRTRAFISYTHSSESAFNTAKALHSILADMGVYCFLDCNDIERGTNWRRSLFVTFSRMNVFIGIADENSIVKIWPAYELEKALRKNSKTASPEIVILAQADLIEAFRKNKCTAKDHVIHVFSNLLKGYIGDRNGSVNIIPLKEKSLEVFAANFTAYRKTFLSVFSPMLSILISGIINLIPSSIGAVSPLISVAAVGALVADGSTHWMQVLDTGFLFFLAMAGAFLSGFSANLALITGFEITEKGKVGRGLGKSLWPLVFAVVVLGVFTLRLVSLSDGVCLFAAAAVHVIGYLSARGFAGYADHGMKGLLQR